jgi:electron transfer flavoprotein beta subunit
MDIAVLIKRVPDPNIPPQFISVSEQGDEIVIHPAAQQSLNLYDLNALECALALKDRYGAKVTVISADDISGETHIRRALSMGADRAIRVDIGKAQRNDPFGTARAIASAIKGVGIPELVLAGRQSSDTDSGYVPFLVSYALAMPALSPVIAVGELLDGKLRVGRLAESTVEHFELSLPAMVLVSNELNRPRVPSLKGVMAAKKMPVETLPKQPESDTIRRNSQYALKPQKDASERLTYSSCSTEEKATALLASIGK